MGCDIHMFTEKWNDNKKRWESFDFFEVNEYYTTDDIEDEDYDGEKYTACEFDDHRWYDKFCILQNGVRREATGPYVEDKGFPSDACPEIARDFKRWDCDAHSPNWCTVAEFRDLVMKYRLLSNSNENPLTSMHEALEAHIKRKLKWEHIIEATSPEHIRLVYWFDN